MLKTIEINYPSISALTEQCVKNWADDEVMAAGDIGNRMLNMDARFNTTQAVEAGRRGGYWPEGAADLGTASIDLSNAAVSALAMPAMQATVAGGSPCVPAYLSGNPVNMRRLHFPAQPNRLFRIGVDTGGYWGVEPEEMFRRGRAIMAAVNAISAAGYSVELFALSTFFTESCGVVVRSPVKASDRAWSPDAVAFCLANNALDRRLIWSELGRLSVYGDDNAKVTAKQLFNGGLGNGEKGDAMRYRDGYDLFVPYVMPETQRRLQNDADALRYVSELVDSSLARK